MEQPTPDTSPELPMEEIIASSLTAEEISLVWDGALSKLRDEPASFVMYDDSKSPPLHVVRAVQRYDCQVFFRWNMVICRWEVWRWKGGTAERPWRSPRRGEIGRRAVFCYVLRNQDRSYRPVGEYILTWLYQGDPWRKWSRDLKRTLAMVDDEDEAEEVAEDQEITRGAEDWACDNRRQINEFFGHGSPIFVMPGEKKA